MIPYIGDVSKADAKVLRYFASISDNILEFGSGASTQILCAYSHGTNKVISLDTENVWMARTMTNISLLGIKKQPLFIDYRNYGEKFTLENEDTFDFVFNDGADDFRRSFAISIWPSIKVGGILAFHDTRRPHDARNFVEVIAHFHNEIDEVHMNMWGSNISTIRKKELEPYDNWQITEKRQPWQLGYDAPPKEFVENLKIIHYGY